MPRPLRYLLDAGLPRRLCSSLTLACYLVVALNLPLPAGAAPKKDGETPFPCQHHACGCVSAEQCWRDCCCYTPSQRLAWAQRNQVEPPPFLVQNSTTSNGWRTTRLRDRDPSKPKASCCSRSTNEDVPSTDSTCEPTTDPETDSTESDPSCPSCQVSKNSPTPVAEKGTEKTSRWVLAMSALKCQGQSTAWVQSGAAIAGPSPMTWHPTEPFLTLVPLLAIRPFLIDSIPADPPPR